MKIASKRTVDEALALYLARLTLRSPLSADERSALLALPARSQRVGVERDFVQPGDKVDHACLVIDGLVARFAQIRDGSRSFVALHIPGDMADLHSVVLPRVTWALHALTPSTILRVPHAALREISERFPAVSAAFWRDCVVDANVLAQWTVNMSRKEALGRVAHLLCEMAERYSAIGVGDRSAFPLPITQADMSDAVGLTPVHLNRVLKRLGEQGLAAKDSATVRILNWQLLCAVAEFEPDYLQLSRDTRDQTG